LVRGPALASMTVADASTQAVACALENMLALPFVGSANVENGRHALGSRGGRSPFCLGT
jgi:hypothetical protein